MAQLDCTVEGQAHTSGTLGAFSTSAVGMNIQTTVSAYGNAVAVLTYNSGLVRIDIGEEIIAGIALIEVQGVQLLSIPYIDTGADWLIGS